MSHYSLYLHGLSMLTKNYIQSVGWRISTCSNDDSLDRELIGRTGNATEVEKRTKYKSYSNIVKTSALYSIPAHGQTGWTERGAGWKSTKESPDYCQIQI